MSLDQVVSALDDLLRNVLNQALGPNGLSGAAEATANQMVKLGLAVGAAASPVISAAQPLIVLAMRTTSLTSQIYGAEKAFSSLTPILAGITTSFQNIINFSSGLKETGPAGAALSKALSGANMAVNRFTGIMNFQLESAQKVTDTFINLSSIGATFGASINFMALRAQQVGAPIQMMGKVIQANLENISQLGSTMERNAAAVLDSTSAIFHNRRGNQRLNDAALALYGSYENLAEGVTGFLALQKQQGVNIMDTNYRQTLTNGTLQEYLIRMKELSSLTGKNIKTLQAEEAERRTNLAYQQTINALGEGVATNFAAVEAVAGRLGPEMKQIARSLFAGQELTPEQRQIAAMAQPAVDMIQRMVDAAKNLDPKAFQVSVAKMAQQAGPELKAWAASLSDIAALPPGASPVVDVLTRIAALGNTAFTDLVNMGRTLGQVQTDTEDALKGLDPATRGMVHATRSVLKNQLEIDTAVTNNMQKMTGVTDILMSLQTQVLRMQYLVTSNVLDGFNKITNIDPQTSANALVNMMQQSIESAVKNVPIVLENIPEILELQDKIKEFQARQTRNLAEPAAPAQPATPAPPPAPPPAPAPVVPPSANSTPYATGGVTSGPSLAGEAGPEAVIPLARGAVPLDIDWSPLVSVMRDQVTISNDIRSLLEDTKNIQEDILDATY